jgi:hypothetical protein
MKSLTLILASALCAASPLMAQSPDTAITSLTQPATNHYLLGSKVVQLARADFQSGAYTEFLKEMDIDYRNAKKANDLEGLIELRKETAKIKIHPEFAKAYRIIQEAKNKDLLVAASTLEETAFTQKVESAAAPIAEIDDHLQSLSYKVPGSGANSDENKLIEIGVEYYYKAIHLDSLSAKNNIANCKQKHMALEMEKMSRMLDAAKSFTDKQLKSSVQDAASILDQRIAKSYDMSDLIALSKGKIKPLSKLEQKAATIISNSQGDLAELHRVLLHSIDSEAVQQ